MDQSDVQTGTSRRPQTMDGCVSTLPEVLVSTTPTANADPIQQDDNGPFDGIILEAAVLLETTTDPDSKPDTIISMAEDNGDVEVVDAPAEPTTTSGDVDMPDADPDTEMSGV